MFSIIIPVFNKANTIRETIDSILSQTISDYEIIVVNDGSTDKTEQILKNYTELKVINQKNQGVSVARNTGIKHANGEYLCFLDGDDIWLDNHLEVLSNLINKYSTCNCYITSHIEIKEDGKSIHSNHYLSKYQYDFEHNDLIGLLNKTSYTVVNTNSICVKTTFLKDNNILFEPNIKIGEDTDVWYRVGLMTNVAVCKEETTVYRRMHSTATKHSSFTFDWVFINRINDIINNENIAETRKKSAIELYDRYTLTTCRELIIINEGNKARKLLKRIRNKCGKRYFVTKLLCYIPIRVAMKICRVINY